MSEITYTKQDRNILRRACAGMGTSTYQPAAEDVEAANRLIALGLIAPEPGFATLTATGAGHAVYADLIDADL